MKQSKERQRLERVQATLDFRAAEMRRQVESMKVAATTAVSDLPLFPPSAFTQFSPNCAQFVLDLQDDGADDGGFSDEFESLFNSLKDQYVTDDKVEMYERKEQEERECDLLSISTVFPTVCVTD